MTVRRRDVTKVHRDHSEQGRELRKILDEAITLRADYIGHLEGWPVHLFCSFRERFTFCGSETGRLSSGFATARR